MNSKYVYAFAGLLLGLTACSNEDLLNQAGQHNGETVFVSLSVDRSLQGTRTILSEADADGGVGLSSVWAKGDKVTLVSASGQVAGTLTLEGEGGESEGVFSGELSIADGKYAVWYLGAEPAYAKFEENSLVNALATSGCAVSGDFSDLNKGELMKSEVEIIVRDGKASVAENVTLAPQMAMAHFTLAMDGLETALAADGSKLTLSYSVGETPYSYTITNKKADVYVPLFPGEYAPSFTLASEGKTYTYAFANETIVEAGLYYTGDKNSTTGESEGIRVTLKDPDENDPYEGYENEDPRNPLHKFAKYNLTRGEDNLNVFVENDDAYGALYQWGRYYGFVDVTSNSGFGLYTLSSTKYSQFAEALGSKKQIPNDVWDFEVYDANGNNMYINYNYPATGLDKYVLIAVGLNYNSSYYAVNFDYPMFYSSKEHIVTDRPYYMMDGNPINNTISLLKTAYNPPSILEEYTNSGDYWVEAFNTDNNKGGENWADRSDAQGFTEDKANPCPAGWRLPTSEEMQEIVPKDGLYIKNGNLATMLQNYSELRTSKNGYNYAIRWNYSSANSYIEIEAVVVDDTYTDVAQLTSEFWTSHSKTTVVRRFPFTGGIRPFTGQVYGTYTYDTIICRPMSMGKPNFIDKGDMPYVGLVDPNESISINRYFGGYWVNEKGMAMKFCAKNYERKVNEFAHDEESEYTRIRMEETGPAFGMAIRPVMDK